eukprot:1274326-Rhodomonas_salina.2
MVGSCALSAGCQETVLVRGGRGTDLLEKDKGEDSGSFDLAHVHHVGGIDAALGQHFARGGGSTRAQNALRLRGEHGGARGAAGWARGAAAGQTEARGEMRVGGC